MSRNRFQTTTASSLHHGPPGASEVMPRLRPWHGCGKGSAHVAEQAGVAAAGVPWDAHAKGAAFRSTVPGFSLPRRRWFGPIASTRRRFTECRDTTVEAAVAVERRGIGEQRAGGEEGAAGDGGAVAVGQAAVAGQGSHGRLSPIGRGAGSDSSPPVGPLQIGFLPNCYAADRRFLWLFPRGGPGYDGFTSTLGPRRNDMENTITTRLVLGRGAGRVLPLARRTTLFVVRGRVRLPGGRIVASRKRRRVCPCLNWKRERWHHVSLGDANRRARAVGSQRRGGPGADPRTPPGQQGRAHGREGVGASRGHQGRLPGALPVPGPRAVAPPRIRRRTESSINENFCDCIKQLRIADDELRIEVPFNPQSTIRNPQPEN